MHFTLRQLEVFVAIARLENVSRAADQLGMSQSAASTALAELERRSDCPLFDRAGKRLSLNEVGRSLLPKALEMLDRGAEIDALLAGRGGPGLLRLGATVTIGNYLAPDLLARYWRRYPNAPLTLDIDNTRNIAARTIDFELDLALVEGECSDPELDVSDWLPDSLAVFCAPQHPLAGAGPMSVARVLEECWVVREKGSGTRQTIDRAVAAHGGTLRIGIELEHLETILRAVEIGSFIGCVSRRALAESFASGRLVEIPVPDLRLDRRFHIVLNRQKYRTPAINAFLGICREMS